MSMFNRPTVLDLFCGAGGASIGYARAGFDVVGVDINPQPAYPFTFYQADALDFARNFDDRAFNLVHASPPCQGYSHAVTSADSEYVPTRGQNEPRLIEPLRAILSERGVPFVIENVMGARFALIRPAQLCGSMFDLPTPRHRLFEADWLSFGPTHPRCFGIAARYAAANGIEYRDMSITGKGRRAGTSERWLGFMGLAPGEFKTMPTQDRINEMIPPAYTKWIGGQFLYGA